MWTFGGRGDLGKMGPGPQRAQRAATHTRNSHKGPHAMNEYDRPGGKARQAARQAQADRVADAAAVVYMARAARKREQALQEALMEEATAQIAKESQATMKPQAWAAPSTAQHGAGGRLGGAAGPRPGASEVGAWVGRVGRAHTCCDNIAAIVTERLPAWLAGGCMPGWPCGASWPGQGCCCGYCRGRKAGAAVLLLPRATPRQHACDTVRARPCNRPCKFSQTRKKAARCNPVNLPRPRVPTRQTPLPCCAARPMQARMMRDWFTAVFPDMRGVSGATKVGD
jgi:hypothetical protein